MAADDARAFWIEGAGQGAIRPEIVREPHADEVLVRALFSGISRGTEALVFQGRVPATEYERMRAPFQVGAFPAPVKYGYASVGRVERGPHELEGKHVFVLHPHQTHYVVPASSVHILPEGAPPARAVLTANLETAINGVWDAGVQIGDRVVVIGAGAVGCLAAWLASRIPGCEVSLVDVNPHRGPIARALGVTFTTPDELADDADVVHHASGSPEGLALALQVAGFEATIVELSWHGDRAVPLLLGSAFHARRLRLQSSQVGSVATAQRARWNTRRRMRLALNLLAHKELDALITGESRFDDLPEVMARLATTPGDELCHRIRY
jgi:threonine dehydrogenase-like Zn-dependent dehydrogenase